MQLAPGGTRYVAALGVLGVLIVFISPYASAVAVALALFVAWFFRDPDRDPPDAGIVSPADGRVSRIDDVARSGSDRLRVCVFMNVQNVHVNRAPLPGEVANVEHVPGAHRPAFSKDSDRNERVEIDVGDYEVTLIAGAFARRITPYVEPGDTVARGERIGHIAFGSRADVLLPAEIDRGDLRIATGDRVRAGETVLAPE